MNEESISKAVSEAMTEQFKKQTGNPACGLGIDRDLALIPKGEAEI